MIRFASSSHSFMSASTERRKANEKAFRALRKRNAKIAGRQPLRDPKYLAWIRTMPCIVCLKRCGTLLVQNLQETQTEAAHVGDRGFRQKCSDRETLPICAGHHRTFTTSQHVLGKAFWNFWHLDREALIAAYNLAYEERES